jgi:hypothetical protein
VYKRDFDEWLAYNSALDDLQAISDEDLTSESSYYGTHTKAVRERKVLTGLMDF